MRQQLLDPSRRLRRQPGQHVLDVVVRVQPVESCRLQQAQHLVSDGLNCFQVASSAGAIHDREITGGGKASVLNDKFKAVNTLIGNVKTALTGTYHAIKFAKYAYRYLAEVQFRFNRRYDLRAILGDLLVALVRAPRRPQ